MGKKSYLLNRYMFATLFKFTDVAYKKGPCILILFSIVLRRRDTKELTCLLRHITTEKSGVCQYAVCITQNTMLKK